jgi:hypothetical protein
MGVPLPADHLTLSLFHAGRVERELAWKSASGSLPREFASSTDNEPASTVGKILVAGMRSTASPIQVVFELAHFASWRLLL